MVGVLCSAVNCNNYHARCGGLSFFRFPKDVKRCKLWLINCRRADLDSFFKKEPTYLYDNCRLCSKHFEDSQFVDPAARNRLKSDAVPTIFDVPNPPHRIALTRQSVKRHAFVAATCSQDTTVSESILECVTVANNIESQHVDNAEMGELPTHPNEHVVCEPVSSAAYLGDHSYCTSKLKSSDCLTRKISALRQIVKRQRVAIHRLRKRQQHAVGRQRSHARQSLDQKLNGVIDSLPKAKQQIGRFFASQIRLCMRNKFGRRYQVTDKSFALSLYYASPRAYRMCSKLFCLPSVTMLRLWMRKMHLTPGFSKDVFVLLQHKASKMTESERVCALVLDEMSLKSGLTYCRSSDTIVGFENYGEFGSSEKIANHALVLMARGILNKWKQPLAYFYVSNTTSAERLKVLVEQCIKKLSAVGFTTACVICDQGATNQQMFRLFGVDVDKPYAVIDDKTVNFMFDPPHLLKCLRNNLMKHDFIVKGNVVSWKYIADFYERDAKQTVKLAPKLTEKHLNLPPFAAMRVRLAAQVLSHSVAAGISTHVAFGALPPEALHTADFIENVDGLFDCLNAGCLTSAKQYSRALSVGSAHWKHMQSGKDIFKNLKVVGAKAKVPCIDGFIITIDSVKMIFDRLRADCGFKFLLTNRLNQDCLENHFATIRSRGGFRDNPDPYSFGTSFRQVVVKHLLCPPSGTNCDDDMTEFLLQLQDTDNLVNTVNRVDVRLDTRSTACLPDLELECIAVVSDIGLCDDDEAAVLEENAVTYVAGYVCKKVLHDHDCVECRNLLLKASDDKSLNETFLHCKLYKNCSAESLHCPSPAFERLISACNSVFCKDFDAAKHKLGVQQSLRESSISHINDLCSSGILHLEAAVCCKETVEKAIALFFRVMIYHKLKIANRSMTKASGAKRRNRKAMKVVHE